MTIRRSRRWSARSRSCRCRTDAGNGGSLNGAWGWAIPKSRAQSRCGLDLPQVGRVPGDRQEARACRRLADPHRRVRRCRGAREVSRTAQALKQMLLDRHNFPVFTYTPQFVEVLGRELSLAVAGEKSREEALPDRERGVRRAAREGRQAHEPARAHRERDERSARAALAIERARPAVRLADGGAEPRSRCCLVILFPVVWALFTSLIDYTLIAPTSTPSSARQLQQARSEDAEFRHALWVTAVFVAAVVLLEFVARLPGRADAQHGRARQERSTT